MKKYRFKGLLQRNRWLEDVSISIDGNGLIVSIDHDHTDAEFVPGLAMPGFQNAHSHAFQYAMAGLAEHHNLDHSSDNFWSWRESMYQIGLTISPEVLEAIATMLYSEMIRHGYTQVAEFHYLHHDKEGKAYANLAEHGERLVAAAKTAGIKITLIPIFYQKGGFGRKPEPRQKRFICKTVQDYYRLWEASEKSIQNYQSASIGYGIHSLRAVDSESIKEVLSNNQFSGPFHIHIAEQPKEIKDSIAFYGRRPIEWLMENNDVNSNYQLVHATHLKDSEVQAIANSGAHVVLCPSTEGNLGDGIFPLREFQELGGSWSIGTDSNIGLNPCEEFRILDYGQRLTTHERNTFANPRHLDSALYAFDQAQNSGIAAMGNYKQEYFEIGYPLDAVVFDADQPLLSTSSKTFWLSTILYSSDVSWIKGTIVNGSWIVKDQHHQLAEKIKFAFKGALAKLNIR